jgi:hypothetical protein
MNDVRGSVGKKKAQMAKSTTAGSAKAKAKGGKLDALMASVDNAGEVEEIDDTPFVSTVVYSDDEQPQEEEATFADAGDKKKGDPEEKNKDGEGDINKDRVDSAGRERRVTILPSKKEKPKKGSPVKRRMTVYTTLVFVDKAGFRKEIDLDRRPITYAELQREIARLTPHSQQMFVIQNERGEKVFPENYIPSAKLIVRELYLRPPSYSKMLMKLGTRYESEEYHEAKHRDRMSRVEDD